MSFQLEKKLPRQITPLMQGQLKKTQQMRTHLLYQPQHLLLMVSTKQVLPQAQNLNDLLVYLFM